MIWRWIAGGLALGLGVLAVLFWRDESARADDTALADRPAVSASGDSIMAPQPAAPEASEKTREERRFNRYDKDRDGRVSQEEYLASRRKAYAKLDTNGDGRLSFDEWAAKITGKFAKADADASKTLSRSEFATTAVKRKVQPKPSCAPAPTAEDDDKN